MSIKVAENQMTDKEFLSWIRDRLEYRHGENPRLDYMIKLKQIINDMDGEIREVPPCPNGRVK